VRQQSQHTQHIDANSSTSSAEPTFLMLILQVEKQRVGLQHELDDLSQRLDEAGGATQAQVIYTT